MPVNDDFIEDLGSWVIEGSADRPLYFAYDLGSSETDVTLNYLETEMTSLRKSVSWYFSGGDPRAVITLETTDANGSSIYGVGLTAGSTSLGSDVKARELSAISYKDNSFIVTSNIEFRFRRG